MIRDKAMKEDQKLRVRLRAGLPAGCSRLLMSALLLLSTTGCLQLQTNIKVDTDGGVTVTERLRLSRDLLDLGGKKIETFLSLESATERAKHMGEGVQLINHEIKNAEEGAREAIAVYRINDINKLVYCSPFLSNRDYLDANAIGFKMYPVYESTWFGHQAGEMALGFRKLDSDTHEPAAEKRYPQEPEEPKLPTPEELQTIRELGLVFHDMLRGFELKLTFESFSGVRTGFGYRDRTSGTKIVDLLHISDRNLDKFGFPFIENEELMLSLLKGELAAPVIIDHIKDWANNNTLPVYHPWGSKSGWWVARSEIFFKPSKQMFNQSFSGKELDFGKAGKRMADPTKDPWQGN